jgi:hypothetical protein
MILQSYIKCLIIGKEDIGKSEFCSSFPNVKCLEQKAQEYKIFIIETMNKKCEKVTIEIDVYDIQLGTCLYDSDLLINNKVMPLNRQFINTSKYNVIVLCFASNDPVSFQLIKSKWEIDFKKNKNQKHSFVVLSLNEKSVTFNNINKDSITLNYQDETVDFQKGNMNKLRQTLRKFSPKSKKQQHKNLENEFSSRKRRSGSSSSLSSTSKVHSKKSSKNFDCSSLDYESYSIEYENDYESFAPDSSILLKQLSQNEYKKFAKLASQSGLIEHNKSSQSIATLDSYDKFLNAVIKANEQLIASDCKKGIKLTRSITSPISLLSNRSKLRKVETQIENNKINMPKGESTFTIRDKLHQFAVNVGTYVVTCGTAKSRKLHKMNTLCNQEDQENTCLSNDNTKINNKNNVNNSAGLLLRNRFRSKGKKEWLLLTSSQLSLDSTDCIIEN